MYVPHLEFLANKGAEIEMSAGSRFLGSCLGVFDRDAPLLISGCVLSIKQTHSLNCFVSAEHFCSEKAIPGLGYVYSLIPYFARTRGHCFVSNKNSLLDECFSYQLLVKLRGVVHIYKVIQTSRVSSLIG